MLSVAGISGLHLHTFFQALFLGWCVWFSASTDAGFVENAAVYLGFSHTQKWEKHTRNDTSFEMRYSTQLPKRKGEVQLELIMRIYREEDKFHLFSWRRWTLKLKEILGTINLLLFPSRFWSVEGVVRSVHGHQLVKTGQESCSHPFLTGTDPWQC